MVARNADRGGERKQVRAEAKHWNDLLREYVDLSDRINKLRHAGGAS